jgi:glycosyltransferase involved in cell wall biosynthesis/predicted metal-dependent phosphoesterase TrpH
MIPSTSSRVDMHCHSTASALAKLGVQQALGLPECATPPEEVYELAKRRGMDFVTITDHDTIDGCLELADRPDVFVSEELTTWFAGEEQAVHVLCYGITESDHAFLQEHAHDLEECAAYLAAHDVTCALAHPFFSVAAPLGPRHRRRLAELFGVWETRNGSRAPELNSPAAVYVETHGGIGIGGSDDHAGVDIGRTWTEVPAANTPAEFLANVRDGRAVAGGAQGSAAKWAHAAVALVTRVLALGDGDLAPASPARVLEMAERVVREGGERGGAPGETLGPDDARTLLAAWLQALELPVAADGDPLALVHLMQEDGFSHSELYRRARGRHERLLRAAVERVLEAAERRNGYPEAAAAVFDACIPVVPYVPSISLLAGERSKLADREAEPHRVALIADAAGSMHGVTHTIERIREEGVPGYEVEVIGTDARVDRRLPAVAEVEMPFYPGMTIGVPSVPELVETLADGRYEAIHVTAPGPAGIAATIAARIGHTPLVASHHTELVTYAGMRSGDSVIASGVESLIAAIYAQARVVLSPSPSADRSVLSLGTPEERLGRWARGVDLELYDPAKRDASAFPGEVRVLYAGRLSREKGSALLADAFLQAHERDPRLHLLLAGGGPEEAALRERLGDRATFLGWLDREELARAYASADVFLFCSQTDTYGQVIAEAQASGLAVVAVGEGGPATLISDRHTGWLCRPEADELAAAVAQLAASRFLRTRLAGAGREAVRERSWEASLTQLAAGYDRALGLRARNWSLRPSSRVA